MHPSKNAKVLRSRDVGGIFTKKKAILIRILGVSGKLVGYATSHLHEHLIRIYQLQSNRLISEMLVKCCSFSVTCPITAWAAHFGDRDYGSMCRLYGKFMFPQGIGKFQAFDSEKNDLCPKFSLCGYLGATEKSDSIKGFFYHHYSDQKTPQNLPSFHSLHSYSYAPIANLFHCWSCLCYW